MKLESTKPNCLNLVARKGMVPNFNYSIGDLQVGWQLLVIMLWPDHLPAAERSSGHNAYGDFLDKHKDLLRQSLILGSSCQILDCQGSFLDRWSLCEFLLSCFSLGSGKFPIAFWIVNFVVIFREIKAK